jgi:hypothetical protein
VYGEDKSISRKVSIYSKCIIIEILTSNGYICEVLTMLLKNKKRVVNRCHITCQELKYAKRRRWIEGYRQGKKDERRKVIRGQYHAIPAGLEERVPGHK